MLTKTQAAQRTGKTVRDIDAMIASGRLPTLRCGPSGRRIRIAEELLDALT